MNFVSGEFSLTIILIFFIFVINVSQILYLILGKSNRTNGFFRSIIFNFSFSSLIVALWLIPFFYFRTHWSPESLSWRIWSFVFHIIDAVQLYSLLLLITNSSAIHLSLQRVLIGLSWFAPILAYSPLLWLSSSFHSIDYMPYRRLSLDVPWWILPILYSSMYLVPILISLVLIGSTFCWPWIYRQYEKRRQPCQREENEHRENMAELTSLIETVLNFELDQSTLNVRPSDFFRLNFHSFFLRHGFHRLHPSQRFPIHSLVQYHTKHQKIIRPFSSMIFSHRQTNVRILEYYFWSLVSYLLFICLMFAFHFWIIHQWNYRYLFTFIGLEQCLFQWYIFEKIRNNFSDGNLENSVWQNRD